MAFLSCCKECPSVLLCLAKGKCAWGESFTCVKCMDVIAWKLSAGQEVHAKNASDISRCRLGRPGHRGDILCDDCVREELRKDKDDELQA